MSDTISALAEGSRSGFHPTGVVEGARACPWGSTKEINDLNLYVMSSRSVIEYQI